MVLSGPNMLLERVFEDCLLVVISKIFVCGPYLRLGIANLYHKELV